MGFDPVDYLLAMQQAGKAGGGGVTVEPITITENGTKTAPAGKAYSPVTVAVPTPDPAKWVRPSDWPDLDAITMPSYDCIYLTYDLRRVPLDIAWIGVACNVTNSAKWTIERGTLNAAGVFTADFRQTGNESYYVFREMLNPSNGNVQLWRIYCEDGDISFFGFVPLTDTAANNPAIGEQPCVERRAIVHITTNPPNNASGTNPSFRAFHTYWMESDNISMRYDTTLNCSFTELSSLRRFILSGKTIENNAPSINRLYSLLELSLPQGTKRDSLYNLYNNFAAFPSMVSLDLSMLDVSAVTNANLFGNYIMASTLNLSGLDLRSVTTASGILGNLLRLQTLIATGMKLSSDVTVQTGEWQLLENLYPWDMQEKSISFSSSRLLTRDSVLRIIDALPTTSETVTLTLGDANIKKVSADEIAVATAKGWTVA